MSYYTGGLYTEVVLKLGLTSCIIKSIKFIVHIALNPKTNHRYCLYVGTTHWYHVYRCDWNIHEYITHNICLSLTSVPILTYIYIWNLHLMIISGLQHNKIRWWILKYQLIFSLFPQVRGPIFWPLWSYSQKPIWWVLLIISLFCLVVIWLLKAYWGSKSKS